MYILFSTINIILIKVFDYIGNFLRQIGGEGITNYPIGVGINSNNEILVADNHNNFNLTVFSQDGQLINALESKVKHAQCFDVGLMDDGSIVLASKDYRIYVYKYVASSMQGFTLIQPSIGDFSEGVSTSQSGMFSMFSTNNDENLNTCANMDDQEVIDNFDAHGHIENLFNDESSSNELPADIDLDLLGSESYFANNFSILNEIL